MAGEAHSAAKSQPLAEQSYGLAAAASCGVDGPRKPSTSCGRGGTQPGEGLQLCAVQLPWAPARLPCPCRTLLQHHHLLPPQPPAPGQHPPR